MKWCSIVLFLSLILGCHKQSKSNDPFDHLEDKRIRRILENAIQVHGGLENWRAIKSLNYRKDFQLFDANGQIEKSFEQIHQYTYIPFSINIQSRENGVLTYTTYKDNRYSQQINGSEANIDSNRIKKSINTSTYVIGIPFKLLDRGAKMKYLGKDSLPNGQLAEVLQVIYDADQYENHSTSDEWRYYFDPADYKVLANWVKTSDHANLILNESFIEEEGFLLFHKRSSYRLDQNEEIDFLRASYDYHDYEIAF